MEVQKLLIKSSIQFENTEFKSKFLQFIYFCCSFIFSIPILATVFDNHSPLFPNSQIHNNLISIIDQLVTDESSVLYTILIIFVIISALIFYIVNGKYNPIIIKLLTFVILVICACRTFFCFLLIDIITRKESSIEIIGLSLIGVIQIQIYGLILQKFWITFSFTQKNIFAHKSNRLTFNLNLIQRVVFFFQSYLILANPENFSSIQQNLFQFVYILINGAKLLTYCSQKFYIDQLSNYCQIIVTTFSFSFVLVTFINGLIPQETIISQNQLAISVIIGLFALTTINSHLNNKQNQLYFYSFQLIVQQKLIVSYLQNNKKLWKSLNGSENSIIISSLRKNHSFQCKKVDCYCRHDHQSQIQINQSFFKGYLKQMVEYFSKQMNNEHIKMYLLNFQLEVFENPLGIGREVKSLKLHNRIPFEIQLGIALLQDKLYDSVNKKILRSDQTSFQLPLKLDQTLVQIEDIILNDIQIKNHKWQYLCRSLIKSLDIEEDIVKEIANISRFQAIFHENKYAFKKSLSFNAICLFYYAQIVFLKKQVKGLEANLKEIKSVINYNFIISYRQLSKNIFDSRCCLLQIDLSQSQINHTFSFSVSNCNRNVQNLFKYSREKLIGKSVSQLYPSFLWEKVKTTFLSYLSESNNEISSHCYDNYFLDKSSNVFKALQCLKVISKPDGVYLFLLLFQKQTDSIILLDQNKRILNTGEVFKKYFGNTYEGLPFQAFFYREQQFHQMVMSDKITQWQPSLIYGQEIGKQWKLYLQRVKAYINKQFTNPHKQRTPATLKQLTIKKNINEQISEFISELRHKLMMSKITSEGTQQTAEKADNKSKSVLVTHFEVKKCQLWNIQFFQVFLESFKRRKADRIRKRTRYDMVKQSEMIPEYSQSVNSLRVLNEDDDSFEGFQVDNDERGSIDIQEQERLANIKRQNIMFQNNSVQSSVKGESITYFYHNFIDICFNLFKNPQEILDRRLNRFTGISFLMSLSISVMVIFTQVIFNLGLHEIKDIFFADGAVSDNMQLTEFMYNRAMNFKQYRNDSIQFTTIALSAYDQRQYLISLLKYDVKQMSNSVTKMTDTKFYQYLRVPVTWSTDDIGPVTIQTSQLLVFYYYLSRQVQTNILLNTAQSNLLVQNNLQLMKMNFPQLKRINHYYLNLYKQMSDRSLSLINRLIFVLGAGHLLLSLVIFLVYYREKVFRRKQQVEGYSIYKLIPKRIIQILSAYYLDYSQFLRQRTDLLKYQTHFQRQGIYLPSDGSAFLKPNNSKFITNNFKSPLAIYKMSFVLFVINLIFGAILYKVSQLAVPIGKMMNNVNNLMDSENYLLQTYFDFKAQFIIDENYTVSTEFLQSILQSQKSNYVTFNQIAIQSLNLFSNYDDTYTTDFINLLINNTCVLAKSQITPQQYNKCISYFKLNMISDGVILGMNFFTRKIKQTILQFKYNFSTQFNKNLTQSQKQTMWQTFQQIDFRQIDQSIIFMFKMYQATQARIYLSLQKTIVNLLSFSLIIVIIEVIIIGLMYPIVLFLNHRNQKIELSKIYVSFLLIPTPISKMIKAFAGKIEQVLEVDKNFE